MQAIGLTKTNGAVKAKSSLSARGRILHGRTPATSNHPRNVGSTQSINVGTRKMVNYACSG